MQWLSSSQSPRSIRRQRWLQKGRQRDSGVQGTVRPQVGQDTVLGMLDSCVSCLVLDFLVQIGSRLADATGAVQDPDAGGVGRYLKVELALAVDFAAADSVAVQTGANAIDLH